MMSISKMFVFLLFLGICSFAFSDDSNLIVEVANGKIRGHTLNTDLGLSYYAFQEIPYASPPVGNLRFKAPVAPQNWEGILETTNNTKICYQFTGTTIKPKENEDCLYLNVYTPVAPGANVRLPVLLYIYGGGFNYGDYSLDQLGPEFWMDYGIIVITINHRLGPLGFLSTGDNVISGNMGLKDQNMAIAWVKNNIQKFGGDPDKITISGQSSGGASVGYQVLSKKSEGLFWAAILQSGSPLCSWSFQANPKDMAYRYAAALDSTFDSSSDSSTLLEMLQKIPAETFKTVGFNAADQTGQMGKADGWDPVYEDPQNADSFITEYMHEGFKNGNFNKVPILIGIMSEEYVRNVADLNAVKKWASTLDNDVSLIVGANWNVNASDLQTAGQEIRKLYTDGLFGDNLGAFIRYLSDMKHTTASSRTAELQSQYTDVYFYQLSYFGQLGDNQYYIEGADRVQHTSELNYMWRTARNSDLSKFPKSDLAVQQQLLKLWTNFCTYGNPTPSEDSDFQNIIWPKVTPNNFQYLNINTTYEVLTNPRIYPQWKAIIEKFGNPPFATY